MNKEELLKAIMELPKIETDNPISTMNSINVDDLMSAVDRLNKIPDYNDLLKENQELKKQVEEYKDNYNCLLKQKEQFEYIMSKQVDYQGQQKEVIDKVTNELFILKDMIYKPETREENFEIQRKISSIIKRLNGKEVSE